MGCSEPTPLGHQFPRQSPQQSTKDQGRDGPRMIHSLNHSLFSLGKIDVVFSPTQKGTVYVNRKMLLKYNRSITYSQPMSYTQGMKPLLHYVFMFLSIYIYSIPSSPHCRPWGKKNVEQLKSRALNPR